MTKTNRIICGIRSWQVLRLILALVSFGFLENLAFANDNDRAAAIAKQYFDLKKPADFSSTATMVLIDQAGNRKVRKLELWNKNDAGQKRALIRFLAPGDIAGTKFLTVTHANNQTEQRLYLPALKKTRKIAATGKNAGFIGSDFSYYDLESRDFNEATYRLLGENESIDHPAFAKMRFYKIESRPKDRLSPYAKTIMWINSDDKALYQAELYDRDTSRPVKLLRNEKIETVNGFLIPTQIVMADLRDGSKTLLSFTDLRVNAGLKDDLFSLKNLER